MKKVLVFIFIVSSILLGAENSLDAQKKARVEKQIKKEIEREKEYAQKQSFYIDLEGAKVNEESVKDLPKLELDDLDMDSIYD